MANFQRIKEGLEKSGELKLKIGSGEKLELHKHNVSFDESTQEIKLPDIAVIRSHTSETCHTDIQNHETTYYDRVVFEMENPIQDYVPPVID